MHYIVLLLSQVHITIFKKKKQICQIIKTNLLSLTFLTDCQSYTDSDDMCEKTFHSKNINYTCYFA